MRRRLDEWFEVLDFPSLEVTTRPAMWSALALIVVALLAIASQVPGPREFFQLRFTTGIACFLPAYLVGCTIGALWKNRRISKRTFGVSLLVSRVLLLFFGASLVAFSDVRGAGVMAGLLVLVTVYLGHLHKVSLRYPFGLAATAVALGVAAYLSPSREHLSIFAVAGPAAIGGELLFGTVSLRAHQARMQSTELQVAIRAQMLNERTQHAEQLSEAIVRILECNHDASNALSSAIASAGEVTRQLAVAPARRSTDRPTPESTAKALLGSLDRAKLLLEETRRVARAETAPEVEPEQVALLPVIDHVVEEARLRFPRVAIEHERERLSGEPWVLVPGGEGTIQRAIENLVVNACEGDGVRGASRVWVAVSIAESVRALAVQVRDDGPGFAAEELASPVTGFSTRKRNGLGLGLYTAERLIRASGGSLVRKNEPGGGASVTVYLNGGVEA